MNQEAYDQILNYLSDQQLPESFPSTKGNFIAKCRKYTVEEGLLKREGKRVLRKCELEEMWEQLHSHSGINTSWKKINGNDVILRKLPLV